MSIKYLALMGLMAALVFYEGTARAEIISGTVTHVDAANRKITLKMNKTNEHAIVRLTDRNSTANLKTGTRMTLDATREVSGSWIENSAEVTAALRKSAADAEAANAISNVADDVRTAESNRNTNTSGASSASVY